MKKYNRSEIFKRMWQLIKNENMTRSTALALAWKEARMEKNLSALIDEEVIQISSTYRQARNSQLRHSYATKTVLEATETETGILVVDYATPVSKEYRNNGNIDMEFELRHGFYPRSNSSGITNSVGIDFKKVTEVSGETYEIKTILKQNGFKWNPVKKSWLK